LGALNCHPRESGDPKLRSVWILAFAGMTPVCAGAMKLLCASVPLWFSWSSDA
jgi:hypothetical protein